MKKYKLHLIITSLVCFIAVNYLAYMQAYKMTHYSPGGVRTEKPENLGIAQKIEVLFNGVNVPKPVNARTPRDLGLDFKTLAYPTGNGLNLSAWYVPHSKSKAMVLLFHGHAASKSQLLTEAYAFYEQGYDLFLVDFRGSGDSDGFKTSLGYDEAEDVNASVRFVREHWPNEKIILFGNSMGSAAILHSFARYPVQADGVILGCPFDSLFHTVKNRFSIMGLPSFPLAHLLMFWGSVQLGYNAFGFRPSEDAKSVHCPALLLFGARDRNVLPNEAGLILKNLVGTKECWFFPNCGHESGFVNNPDQWKKAVFGFLNHNL